MYYGNHYNFYPKVQFISFYYGKKLIKLGQIALPTSYTIKPNMSFILDGKNKRSIFFFKFTQMKMPEVDNLKADTWALMLSPSLRIAEDGYLEGAEQRQPAG